MRRFFSVTTMGAFAAFLGMTAAPVASARQHEHPVPVPAQLIDAELCATHCAPCIVTKGCPAPCAIEKIVAVTKPCKCCTVHVLVMVPACGCEKVKVHRDGDMKLDYGKYDVRLDWKDHGPKLVVRYHG